jgi:glutamate racemase
MIGLYDSGLGGLTILKSVMQELPGVATMFYADTAACPLGEKNEEDILYYTKSGVSFLFDQGCELVILACNTATAICIRELQNNWLPKAYPNKKILGIIRPVSEKMLEIHTNKLINIGIMGTPATIDSGFYKEEMKSVGYHKIFSIPCLGLADSIDRQDTVRINDTLDSIFRSHQPIIQKLDVLILACTHYPIIREEITTKLEQFGAKQTIKLLSQGSMVAHRLRLYLEKHPEINIVNGDNQFFATKDPADFRAKMKDLFDIDGTVNLIH